MKYGGEAIQAGKKTAMGIAAYSECPIIFFYIIIFFTFSFIAITVVGAKNDGGLNGRKTGSIGGPQSGV
jgi:hypothetical protein